MVRSLFFCTGLALSSITYATDLSGFATLGAVISDSDNYGYRRDVSFNKGVFSGDIDLSNNSVLGLQISHTFSKKSDVVIQGVFRDQLDNKLDNMITMAFWRYQPNAQWQIRLGRVAPDLFLFTETRDVDFSYNWTNVPNEVYGIIPHRYIDGGDISYISRLKYGTLTAKLFSGVSDTQVTSLATIEPIESRNIVGASLVFQAQDWSIQGRHTQMKFSNKLASNSFLANQISQIPDFIWPMSDVFAQKINIKGATGNYSAINAQKQLNNWLLSAEMSQITSTSELLDKLRGYYFSIAYQFDNYSIYSVLAKTTSDTFKFSEENVNTQFIPELISAVEQSFNFYASNQHSQTLGVRYNLNETTALTLQWSTTEIEENGGTLWVASGNSTIGERINTYMLNVSVIF